MSQLSVSSTPKRQPKRFLKKGEGLKRFAAYKPPPPVSTNKLQRRQTFVKFNLDLKKYTNTGYVYPDLPSDDSINLSTEIPKIAPPKIMHTPIRPDRRVLGALQPSTNFTHSPSPPPRYNLRGTRKAASKPIETRKPTHIADLSNPVPGNSVLALEQQIQQIEAALNELKCKIARENSDLSQKQPSNTRSKRRVARSKATEESKESPIADTSIRTVYQCLVNDVNKLGLKFDEINLRR